MNIFTILLRYKFLKGRLLVTLMLSMAAFVAAAQTTTSWTGAISTEWNTAANWTNGLPDITKHVIIGDRSLTNQPVINVNNNGSNSTTRCLSLTIGGAYPADVYVYNSAGLHVETDLIIQPNGVLRNEATAITLKRDWINNGLYQEKEYQKGNKWTYIPSVHFTGTNQAIKGSVVSNFIHLEISGTTTLESDITLYPIIGTYGQLTINSGGVLDPALKKVTWADGGTFVLKNGGTARVKALNYLDNYSIRPTAPYNSTTIDYTSTIDYAAAANQNIDNLITYQKLVISGGGVKSLTGNTTVSGDAADTQVNVNTGTLELGTYTLNRATAGGSFTIASGATLRIGGTNTFPANFTTKTLNANSTVEYYGTAQAVQSNTYGHLILSGSGVKTMPATAMTVAGNLTSAGTVSFTGGANINVSGDITIGVGTTFTGGNYTHTISGNWVRNGTFNHGGGTIQFSGGTNASVTGATVFRSLTINKAASGNYVLLNNEVTATTLNMTNGELRTGADKVVVLGDRTGNGWVVGAITRQHTFASGTAYAFNGPHVKLTFTGGTGITEATMISGTGMPTGFLSGKSVNRMYQVGSLTGGYSSARIQLQYQESELNGCFEDGLKLYRAPASSGIWRTTSRNANSTTENWAAMDGFSDVTGFWTLTDNPSTYSWKGTTSIAWETASNWDVTTDDETTSGITPPISSDFVVLGELTPVYQPSINSSASVRSLKYSGNNQISLSIVTGSLATRENLEVIGAGSNVGHALLTNANSLTVGGDLILNDGSTGNHLTLTNTSGSISVAGNINHLVGSGIVLGSGNLFISGAYNYAAGAAFNSGTGTVSYNGATAQAIALLQYHNLALENSGVKTFAAGTTLISGNLTVAGGATANTLLNSSTLNFNGTGAQAIPGLTYYTMVVSGGGQKSLAGNATINNNLALTNGTVVTGINKFILGSTATITEDENNYVTGLVEVARSVGTAPETFGGIGLSISPAVSPGVVTVTRETGALVSLDSKSAQRNFTILPSGANTGLNATIIFSYFLHELNGVPENRLSVYTTTDNTFWTMMPEEITSRNSSRKTVTLTGVDSLSRFALGEIEAGITPLPVELVYFKASKANHNAILEWKTAMEQNSSGFEIEASADGYTYQKIGFVESKTATSAVAHVYTFTDNRNGKAGMLYYRLRQVDVDGKYKYYGPRTVNFGTVTKTAIAAYPNPFEKEVNVTIETAASGKAKLTLYTTAGKMLLQHEEQLMKGASVLHLNLNKSLPSGLYLLTVEQNGKAETLKLIKH